MNTKKFKLIVTLGILLLSIIGALVFIEQGCDKLPISPPTDNTSGDMCADVKCGDNKFQSACGEKVVGNGVCPQDYCAAMAVCGDGSCQTICREDSTNCSWDCKNTP